MPVGFEDAPEESLLTPEMAEKVVERFAARQAERQRAEAAERERLASMARVQELADLLGTTPEDVMQLAKEVGETPHATRAPLPPMAIRAPEAAPRWPLHAAYLTALAACLAWGLSRGNPARGAQAAGTRPFLFGPNSPGPAVRGVHYDPYVKGYVRDLGATMPWNQRQEFLTDPRFVPPPTGLMVTLVTTVGYKTIVGPPGKIQDSAAAAEALRKSIRSLIAFEESLVKVTDANLPIAGYDTAPWTQSDASFQGQPTLVGWHVVEVATERGNYRALLPDRRYAKDPAAYEKALKQRLEVLSDAKLFPSQPPANLRLNAHKLVATPALPNGMSLMLWNERETAWAQGTGKAADPGQARKAVESAVRQSVARLAASMGSGDHLGIMLTYPMGEYYNSYPLDAAKAYPEGGARKRQEDEIGEISALVANPPKPPIRRSYVSLGP